jgi:N-acetyl-beta-hexosaminidase
MQELTTYALERHIQIVPVIQSPAHFAYVLKHPEFAHLRADSSNYQPACAMRRR